MTVFEPMGIIRLRAAGYRAELGRVEAVLAQVTEGGPAGLDSPARDRFARLFGTARAGLDSAIREGPVTADRWRQLDEARRTVELVGREALAYVECQLLVERGLDGSASAAAARLIASLTGRTGIDRPALLGVGDAECIDHLASVVRFRPLGTTVWLLAVIAHEFGHHAAARLEDARLAAVRPAQAWLARAAQGEPPEPGMEFQQAHAWLHELFADVFATYALGTAYPLSVLAARVQFDRVDAESPTHPPWTLRVATMIAALDSMADLDVGQAAADTYRESSRWLAERWAGLASARPDSDCRTRASAAGMVRLLAEHALPRLRYDVTGPVERLREELDAPDLPPPPGATPAHVLNAAWNWRLRYPEADGAAVSTRALTRCAQAAL